MNRTEDACASKRIVLELKGISKKYLNVEVLSNINFQLRKGTIHGLVGSNGAGKSTMMKIITGAEEPDGGDIYYDEKKLGRLTPKLTEAMGIEIVHQELALVKDMSVADNVFLGREPVGRFQIVDRKRELDQLRGLMQGLKMDIDPGVKVSGLSVADQQLVEIVKALMFEPSVLILDEPTAPLSIWETEKLFAFLRTLRMHEVSIIYITHRLQEIMKLCDCVTILRDGHIVDTLNIGQTTIEEVVKLMIGRDIKNEFPPRKQKTIGGAVLDLKGITKRNKLNDIRLTVRKGEILGIAGLIGSGQRELSNIVFGLEACDAGEIYLNGRIFKPDPYTAVRKSVGFLSENRKADGVILDQSIRRNVTLASLKKIFRTPILRKRTEGALVERIAETIGMRYSSIDQEVQYLSGGNQQKVVIAKWLCSESQFLIVNEPTRGIDLGAKYDIYQVLLDQAATGTAILLISSEFKELIGICDRIAVIHQGAIVREIAELSELTEENLLVYASGKDAKGEFEGLVNH